MRNISLWKFTCSGVWMILLMAMGLLSAEEGARAQLTSATGYWLPSPTDGNWVTSGSEDNWTTGSGANWPGGTSTSATAAAIFNTNSSVTTITIGGTDWNIKNITFDTVNCAAYTLNDTNGSADSRFTAGGVLAMTATVTQPQHFTGTQYRTHTGGGLILSNSAASTTATLSFAGAIKANNGVDANETDQAITLTGANTGSNVFSGVISDYASPSVGYYSAVVKSGAGTWYLTAVNTYTGPTIVNAGLLSLGTAGTVNSSTNVVVNGGTLLFNKAMLLAAVATNGTAAANYLLVTNAGTLTMTNTAFQTPVTVNNFVVSNATLNVGVNGSQSFTNFVVTASGGLQAGPGITINITQVAGVLSATTFPLIAFVGTAPATANFTVTAPSGYTAGPATLNGSLVEVTVTPTSVTPSLVWAGVTNTVTVDGNWNLSDANWLNSGVASAYADPDLVQFDDTSSNSTVTLAATVSPGSTTVTNNVLNYTFNGTGSLAGSGTLNKQGTATLLLDNSGGNTFGGGITIGGGMLQSGNGDANGTLPSGTITDNGTLVFDRTDKFTTANTITGSGAVQFTGSGTNTVSGANSYGGATLISGGKVIVSVAGGTTSALGAIPGGAVTIMNGGTLDVGGGATENLLGFTNTTANTAKQFYIAGTGVGGAGAIVNSGTNQLGAFQFITLTADATIGGTARWDMRGNSTIVPVLNLGGYTLTKIGNNQNSIVSATVTNGNIVIDGVVMSFESSSSVSNGTIMVNSGGALGHYRTWAGAITMPITLNGGAITNLSTSSGGSTNNANITLTADSTVLFQTGSDLYLEGVISQSGGPFGLTKLGTGRVVFTNVDTYAGATLVEGGTLSLVGPGSIADSAEIGIGSGATFDLSGSAVSYILGSGQTLQGLGTGTVNGDLTLAAGAALGLDYTGGTPTLSVTAGALTLNGNATTVTVQNAALAHGVYTLIAAGSGGSVAGALPGTVTVTGAGITNTSGETAFLKLSGGTLDLVVDAPPAIAATVTNDVNSGLTFKIAIADLATAAGWSDADGDVLSLSSVAAASANSVSLTNDGTYIYYNGPVTAQDSFTYTITDGNLTATGAVYLEPVAAQGPSVGSPAVNGSGNPVFSGSGIPGFSYGVESATSLSGPWSNAGTVTAGSNGAWTFTDPNQTNPSVIFYRLYYPYSASNPPQ